MITLTGDESLMSEADDRRDRDNQNLGRDQERYDMYRNSLRTPDSPKHPTEIPMTVWLSMIGIVLSIVVTSLGFASRMGALQERVRQMEAVSTERRQYVDQVRGHAVEIGVLKAELSHMKEQLENIERGMERLLKRN